MVLAFYKQVGALLQQQKAGVLMVVVAHTGSSPGRQGFHMFVTQDGQVGTIGGGMMEHKMVQLARQLMVKADWLPFLKNQVHQSAAVTDRSGMICSGEQTIAFYPITQKDIAWIKALQDTTIICYSQNGIEAQSTASSSVQYSSTGPTQWTFYQPVRLLHKVYIVGGGHIALALSQILALLHFEVTVLNDSVDIPTYSQNEHAHHKHEVDLNRVEAYIPEGDETYVVIASFGYRTDKIIVERLLGRKYGFIGMLGSRAKIDTLWKALKAEGNSNHDLEKIVAPIGLGIKSETAMEIAVSIAAQLIAVKNKG